MAFSKRTRLLVMTNAVLASALMVVMCYPFAAIAGVTFQNDQELFGASFESYSPGDQLCGTNGAYNGTWGEVAEGTAVAVEDTVRGMYMSCAATDARLVFSPYSISEKSISATSISVLAAGYEEVSLMPAPIGARAAFAICAPFDGETNYMGWVCSQNCWTNLYPVSGGTVPCIGEWQEVVVRFLKAGAGREYVQYWLKRDEGGSYIPLKTADGVSWLDAGVSFDVNMFGKVELSGDGGFEWLLGTEPRRGLIVGVGSRYDFLFDESIYNQSQGSSWDNVSARSRSDELRSYIINVDQGDSPVTYNTARPHEKSQIEVTEFEVQFTGPNGDDSIPSDSCARVRVVETLDQVNRFACLVQGQWKTNMQWRVDIDAKYTVEISLDNGNRTVSYRFKEGYGLEGGSYRELFLDEPMQPDASGKTLNIDFEGYGVVHEIRGKNKSN